MARKKSLKGSCYEAAALYALEHPELNMIVVHGIPIGQGEIAGERFGHAWCEYPVTYKEGFNFTMTMVIDPTVSTEPILQPLYYLIGRINPEECRRYTIDELRANMLEHEHYGPWAEHITEALHK